MASLSHDYEELKEETEKKNAEALLEKDIIEKSMKTKIQEFSRK